MRGLVSEVQQCLSYQDGHNIHPRWNRSRQYFFSRVSVSWVLGTKRFVLEGAGGNLDVYHHNPLALAKAIDLSMSRGVFFCQANSVLQVVQGRTKTPLFSVSFEEIDACIDFA